MFSEFGLRIYKNGTYQLTELVDFLKRTTYP